MIARRALIKLHSLLSGQFGFDPLWLLRWLRGLPPYFREWRRFRRGYNGPLSLVPFLQDCFEEGGTTKSEYFWQDLLVARWIHVARPEKHVDVGSRIDGFVALVASCREVNVIKYSGYSVHRTLSKAVNINEFCLFIASHRSLISKLVNPLNHSKP